MDVYVYMYSFVCIYILVSLGCHSKISYTGRLKQDTYFSQFWGLGAWNQGGNMVGFW